MVEIVPRNVNLTRVVEFQAIGAKIEREREKKIFEFFKFSFRGVLFGFFEIKCASRLR